MIRYICKASFALFSLQNFAPDSHTNSRFDAKSTHVAENIRFRAIIRLRSSHTGKYLLQNIRLEANIRKTLCDCHIQANIRWEGGG
jgi:hypothetical protein